MIEKLLNPFIELHLVKLRKSFELFDNNPEIIWAGTLIIGLLACLLIGFNLTFFGLFFMIIGYFISLIARDPTDDMNIYPHYQMSQFIIFGIVIFLIGIEQPLASSFMILTLGVLFISKYTNHNIKLKNPEFGKDRAFHHPTLLIGEYEILIFIVLGSLFSEAFAAITGLFVIACWATIAMRGYDLFHHIKINSNQ